jgi:hypothetical protein
MAAITLTLNDAQQQALRQLLDCALKNSGLGIIGAVFHFVSLIESAQNEALNAGILGQLESGNAEAKPMPPTAQSPPPIAAPASPAAVVPPPQSAQA